LNNNALVGRDITILFWFWLLLGWILLCCASRMDENTFPSAGRKYDVHISQGASWNSLFPTQKIDLYASISGKWTLDPGIYLDFDCGFLININQQMKTSKWTLFNYWFLTLRLIISPKRKWTGHKCRVIYHKHDTVERIAGWLHCLCHITYTIFLFWYQSHNILFKVSTANCILEPSMKHQILCDLSYYFIHTVLNYQNQTKHMASYSSTWTSKQSIHQFLTHRHLIHVDVTYLSCHQKAVVYDLL